MDSFVTYADLRQLLLELGFEEEPAEFLRFHHSATDTLVRLAWHQPGEAVLDRDLVKIRTLLEVKGLLKPGAFEEWLSTKKRQPAAS
jgi:hypothetical protein